MTVQRRVCVIGLGYIGLPTACLFAQSGFEVLGVDIHPTRVDQVNAGDSHLDLEPDLNQILSSVIASGDLKAALMPAPADYFFICVPTPFKEGHRADLSCVEAAVDSILPFVEKGNAIVLESTSPPGTTRRLIADKLAAKGFAAGKDCFVTYCPERVMPGRIVRELKTNSRVVGGITPECARHVGALYREIIDAEVMETSAEAAEVVKLAENSFRDVNIAFANELSMICSRLGVSHREVIRLANLHPRVRILSAGPGVGGHCIAVDPWFLVESFPGEARLIRQAREVNLEKTRFVVRAIREAINERFRRSGKLQTVCLFGMAYKPDVADFRESPAVEIRGCLEKELGETAEVRAVDPHLEEAVPLDSLPPRSDTVLWIRLVAHKAFEGLEFDLDFSC